MRAHVNQWKPGIWRRRSMGTEVGSEARAVRPEILTVRPSVRALTGAVILAALSFSLVVLLRSSSHLYGTWVLGAVGLLFVLLPVSKTFSGRIIWALTVVFGFVPLLWWIPLDWPSNLRSTLLLASVVALAVFCCIWQAATPGGLRRLLPRFALIDCVPLLAAAGGLFITMPGLMVRRVEDAMALMLMSWDNASHFDIFQMQRTHGTVLPLAGLAPDGSRWSFTDYPQGFHSVLVVLSEVARPTGAVSWETALVTYVNFNAIMNILIAVLVVAAVCALPGLRKNPKVGVPTAIFVGSGWIFGPGALATMHGYSNFLFTTAMVVAAVVLCQSMTRVLDPLPLAAVGACVSAVMQNWVPLGVFLLPGILAVLFVTPKGRWNSRRWEWASASFVIALVLAATVTAASQLLTVKAEGILFATGGLPPLDFGLLIALLCILAGMTLFLSHWKPHTLPSTVRSNWSIATVWLGLLVVVGMAVAQLAKTGTLSYYMQKFSIALTLITIFGLAVAVNELLIRRRAVHGLVGLSRSRRLAAASVVVSVGLTQFFGLIFPLQDVGLPATSESGMQLEQQALSLKNGSVAGERILQAVRRSADISGPVMYLTTNPNDVDVILAQQWFDGLRGNYSEHNWNLSLNMFPLSGGPDHLPEVVQAIREADPRAQFIVDPENQHALDLILTSTP